MSDPHWPDTFSLVPPRDPKGRQTSPVMQVLALAAELWKLPPIYRSLRALGKEVPAKAESETAIALHWLLGFALRDGEDWVEAAQDELNSMKAAFDASAPQELK